MAELTDWNDLLRSPRRMAARTFGSGTQAQRLALTHWKKGGFFYDSDDKAFYQNTGEDNAIVWSQQLADGESSFVANIVALGLGV